MKILTKNTPTHPGRKADECPSRYKKFTLLPDKTMHSAGELARMFGVNQTTISSRYKKGKSSYTREELEAWAESLEKGGDLRTTKFRDTKVEPKPIVPRNIHDVDYRPSAMERSMLRI